MDPWSNGDYSRQIQEALIVVEKPPEINPPSGRVPGQVLLAISILGSRRRRNSGEFRDVAIFSGFLSRGVNIGGRRARGEPPPPQKASWRGRGWGHATWVPGWGWAPSGSP